MNTKINKRSYWPELLKQVENWKNAGHTDPEISKLVYETFGLPRQSFRTAVKRGDVPAMASPDRERAVARSRGDVYFNGKPCVTCGSRKRYVSDLRCVSCEHKYEKSKEL